MRAPSLNFRASSLSLLALRSRRLEFSTRLGIANVHSSTRYQHGTSNHSSSSRSVECCHQSCSRPHPRLHTCPTSNEDVVNAALFVKAALYDAEALLEQEGEHYFLGRLVAGADDTKTFVRLFSQPRASNTSSPSSTRTLCSPTTRPVSSSQVSEFAETTSLTLCCNEHSRPADVRARDCRRIREGAQQSQQIQADFARGNGLETPNYPKFRDDQWTSTPSGRGWFTDEDEKRRVRSWFPPLQPWVEGTHEPTIHPDSVLPPKLNNVTAKDMQALLQVTNDKGDWSCGMVSVFSLPLSSPRVLSALGADSSASTDSSSPRRRRHHQSGHHEVHPRGGQTLACPLQYQRASCHGSSALRRSARIFRRSVAYASEAAAWTSIARDTVEILFELFDDVYRTVRASESRIWFGAQIPKLRCSSTAVESLREATNTAVFFKPALERSGCSLNRRSLRKPCHPRKELRRRMIAELPRLASKQQRREIIGSSELQSYSRLHANVQLDSK